MRILRVSGFAVVSLAALAALAGCSLGAPAPTVTATATVTASPTPTPTSKASGGTPLVVGTCRPTASAAIPAIYHVWSDNEKPIRMTVDAFDRDGTSHRTTVTVDGPVATVLSWDDCRSDGTSVRWTLDATKPDDTNSNLNCSLESYNGVLVQKGFSGEGGGTPTVECSAVLNGA